MTDKRILCNKKYYSTHKGKWNNMNGATTECECGKKVSIKNLNRHLKSKLHLKLLGGSNKEKCDEVVLDEVVIDNKVRELTDMDEEIIDEKLVEILEGWTKKRKYGLSPEECEKYNLTEQEKIDCNRILMFWLECGKWKFLEDEYKKYRITDSEQLSINKLFRL